MNIVPEIIFIINQIFELERKAAKLEEKHSMARNFSRLKEKFSELGFEVQDPLGETYNETRTDLEASIAGESSANLRVTDVIKPIVRLKQGGAMMIAQKGIVVVEGQ